MTLAASTSVRVVSGDDVMRHLPVLAATGALEDALRAGLDPDADAPRRVVPTARGQFLLMPSEFGRYRGVKVATFAPDNPGEGRPRLNGSYLHLDAHTLTPVALLDGVATVVAWEDLVVAAAVYDNARRTPEGPSS